MKNKIIHYLSQYSEMTGDIESAIKQHTVLKEHKKGSVLLKEGSISKECYFLLKGCIRSFYLKDGEEITLDLFTEEQCIVPENYAKGLPSKESLVCLEDCMLSVGTPELETLTFNKHPQLAKLAGVIAEQALQQKNHAFLLYKHSTPEQRYLNLLNNRRDLLQRVPLHYIASYLGMKAESLSRIRKRLLR